MLRRHFLYTALALPLFSLDRTRREDFSAAGLPPFRRVRPGDPGWPSPAEWETLNQLVGGRLVKLDSPLAACRANPQGAACAELFRNLKNPYYIGDTPALTQTSGWVDAWTSAPSVYAVAAASSADVVAAVNFAREKKLRLVVKGGGHSYQGTSNSADSLLIWTRGMNAVALHDRFLPQGCPDDQAEPAVSIGAGSVWMHVYDAVTTKGGRYVQGGGCGTVGVAGLIQSGGFGSFSKRYGLAAAGLLEAEVVTADGEVRIANACTNPDLFWALKGGGGGSFGVVTRLTLRTRELPEFFGGVFGAVRASSDRAWRALVARIVEFYRAQLFNPHWGEQIRFEPGREVRLSLVFQGLNQDEAQAVWQPLIEWLAAAPEEYSWTSPFQVFALPARHLWDGDFLKQYAPQVIASDDRPGAPPGNVFWAGDRGDAGQVLHAYRSAWLPASLLEDRQRDSLVEALIAASRIWEVALHFNKGLAGAPESELAAARGTATNPAVLDAFALAIIASNDDPSFPGIRGREPDVRAARRNASAVNRAMNQILKVTPQAGSYVSESDFFERDWQRSYWGPNYRRLAQVKRRYDPSGLFFVHHGVGSEEWSPDGFTRKA